LAASLAWGDPGVSLGEPSEKPPRRDVVLQEFIFEKAPVPSCHASTLAETPSGLVVAWFAGAQEGAPDVGVWLSREDRGKWTTPVEVATPMRDGDVRFPCWNPVLFQPSKGPLLLFYKVGPSPRNWWGMVKQSTDGGKTWNEGHRLPKDILGPIKNKPIELPNGALLCGSSTEHDGWKVHMETTHDAGKVWKTTESLEGHKEFSAIQPTILRHGGRLMLLCRTRQHKIAESWSSDGGKTWSPLAATELPNPNSGIDAVTLKDGRSALVYNHTAKGRSPLNLALSTDGVKWEAALVLEDEPGEFSYPAVIQTADGRIHTTYTWNRKKIKHVVIDPQTLDLRPIEHGEWPAR
jgi:predicted neuraminidase